MKKPYKERTDLERIQSQWGKFRALHTRGEWSAAILRAATGAELAANYAIRKEFSEVSELDGEFVDSLLLWANGIAGKINRLLTPLCKGERKKRIQSLAKLAARINTKRNAIIHQGEFCNKDEAYSILKDTKEFIQSLIAIYEPDFALKIKITKKHIQKSD